MNDIIKLGTITINGITFNKGDNGCQIFYDYEVDGLYYVVLQPKITDRSYFRHPWWAASVWKGNSVCNLNLCCGQLDGTEVKDPFYDLTDSGHDDPPIKLLTAIADLITGGVDPWTLPQIITRKGRP